MLNEKLSGQNSFALLNDEELLAVIGGDMCYCLSGHRWKFACLVETDSESECIRCCNDKVMKPHFLRNSYNNLAGSPRLGGFSLCSNGYGV